MAVSVDVAGKLVNIDVVFKDKLGAAVAAPAGATYAWSVTAGSEFVTVVGSGAGNTVGKVTPVAPGTATVSLTVSGGGLAAPLTGTLEVTVLAMEPESIELNGTVVDAE
ncbi:MAG: hypothetical protein RR877_00565 [Aurantimicrobium sp.]|uniref:hypothetical protein n=1 Tax=Aurantimicrobium sp. TaxID=1930784 RepID=UPI002FC665E4